MRLTNFLIVIAVTLLFLIPNMKKEGRTEIPIKSIQEQVDESTSLTYSITFEAQSNEEEDIVDILWLRKVARFAQKNGTPYFNILEQKITKKYSERLDQELSVMSGLIELKKNSFEAQYDAAEIELLEIEN